MMGQLVVLDTNILIAAGFRPGSDSARIVSEIKRGRLPMAWNGHTRRETERLVHQIPPLPDSLLEGLFLEENRYTGETHPAQFGHIPDPDDRKFAALAEAAGAVLITLDDHLLATRDRGPTPILTPREFIRHGGMPNPDIPGD